MRIKNEVGIVSVGSVLRFLLHPVRRRTHGTPLKGNGKKKGRGDYAPISKLIDSMVGESEVCQPTVLFGFFFFSVVPLDAKHTVTIGRRRSRRRG